MLKKLGLSCTRCYHWEKSGRGTRYFFVLFLTISCEPTIILKIKIKDTFEREKKKMGFEGKILKEYATILQLCGDTGPKNKSKRRSTDETLEQQKVKVEFLHLETLTK